MEEARYSDVCLWGRERLQLYLRERGLPVSGKLEELRALVYGAQYFGVPEKLSSKQENEQRAQQYVKLLTIENTILPDPFVDLIEGWIGEDRGIHNWPPCMSCDISEYLVSSGERDLKTRLLTDYKEGKAYSYFDSKWLKEVFYHEISPESQYCFLKADCTPSMKIHDLPHRVWVCITKMTGKVVSGYCTCFAGLGSTCNHVAAVLFKLDYAWQTGFTHKACTSLPAQWTVPSGTKKPVEVKRVRNMEWRKPHYNKKGDRKVINTVAKKLFCPSKQAKNHPTLESLMGSLYTSCPDASSFVYAFADVTASYPVYDDVNVIQEEVVETESNMPPPLTCYIERYGKLPLLTKCDVEAVEVGTRGQTNNPTWKDQRKGLITGSTAHNALCKFRKIRKGLDPGNMSALVNVTLDVKVKNSELPAIKYGREMEPVARKTYASLMKSRGHKNLKVQDCGLFIHPEHPYMAASPDGLVSCECCGNGILEMKCPYSRAHTDPQASPPSYLTHKENILTLRENHPYYTQVCMQLAVSEFEWCDFFVFTHFGHHLQRIYKSNNLSLITELQETADTVFSHFILPKLMSN